MEFNKAHEDLGRCESRMTAQTNFRAWCEVVRIILVRKGYKFNMGFPFNEMIINISC